MGAASEAPTLDNCLQRLEVQSLLRAWLIQRYRRPLFLMSFAELHCIAVGHQAHAAGRAAR